MSKVKRYCTNCNRLYEFYSAPECQQCGSHKSSTFNEDPRTEDLTRFYANRRMKMYTQKGTNNE